MKKAFFLLLLPIQLTFSQNSFSLKGWFMADSGWDAFRLTAYNGGKYWMCIPKTTPPIITWSDFKGTPKKEHAALSSIALGFSYTELPDGRIMFDSASVTFNPELSYTNTDDPEVLRHEQGHLILAYLLCLYENSIPGIHHIHYSKEQFENMMNEMKRRWDRDDKRYDEETQHSENKSQQLKWEKYFTKELLKYGIVWE